jgi:hypothetical protein
MLKDNDQVRELQRIFARQYMCLEQLRIQLGKLASDTYAANEAAKFIGRRAPLRSRARSKKGPVAPPSGALHAQLTAKEQNVMLATPGRQTLLRHTERELSRSVL